MYLFKSNNFLHHSIYVILFKISKFKYFLVIKIFENSLINILRKVTDYLDLNVSLILKHLQLKY